MSPRTAKGDPWTHRQRLYVQHAARGLDPVQAGLAAGFKKSYAVSFAKRFSTQYPHVMEAVRQLRKQSCEKAGYDLATAMTQAGEDREFAYREKNPNAAVKASELRSKLSGLLIDRIEITAVDLSGALTAARARVIDVTPAASTQLTQAAEQADADKEG